MVKVSIEVRDGATRFNVAVRAESVQRAMSIVRERYLGRSVRAKFPIYPAGSFVEIPLLEQG